MQIQMLRFLTISVAFLIVLSATTSRGQEPAKTEPPGYTLALQRGTQAVIWAIPAVSMVDLRKSAERQLGATYNDIIYFSKPMASRHGFLTANNDVPYVITSLNTTDGPVLLDVPPASDKVLFFGSAIDAWQVPIVDVGPEGQDRGKVANTFSYHPDSTEPYPAAISRSGPRPFTSTFACDLWR